MPVDPATICVLANPGSGRASRDATALASAMQVFGPDVPLRRLTEGESFDHAVEQALTDGYTTLVAAGGDGTVTAIAHALTGTGASLGILPLGTFNFVSRGLGLPEDPAAAARAILAGHPHRISVGTVNGQVFLNNVSIGLYPRILAEREAAYARYGRFRLLAYWTVLVTLIRAQRAPHLSIETDTGTRSLRTPLVFIARSAYQLERFGLSAQEIISDDRFAVFVAIRESRFHLIKLALHLALRRLVPGTDVELFSARRITIRTPRRRPKVAFDGEKRRMLAPLTFAIRDDALSIIIPDAADKTSA
ncbi:diacylglycerol/lipid kinase family protein [Tabrizicola sp. M-4]|uniref:diacylglycerol/lipid kinase family protein n=1 Tax=Tabrizicola sp. M-4 TaxID=3055847 RepID=UPI003DA7B9F9